MPIPDIHYFHSSANLADYITSKADLRSIEIVSFDVFDTLLFRTVSPELIIDSVSRKMCALLNCYNLPIEIDPQLARRQAYKEIAYEKVRKGLDPDMTLDELVPVWVSKVTGQDSNFNILYKQLLAIEYEYERLVTFPNSVFFDLAEQLTGLGKKVIFTSDMYLGHKYISSLLQQARPFKFTSGYVSGDHSLLKRTGRLYRKLLESEDALPGQVIHIGDSEYADGFQAAKNGIHAFILKDPVEKKEVDS